VTFYIGQRLDNFTHAGNERSTADLTERHIATEMQGLCGTNATSPSQYRTSVGTTTAETATGGNVLVEDYARAATNQLQRFANEIAIVSWKFTVAGDL
jgi:hypothetical protein